MINCLNLFSLNIKRAKNFGWLIAQNSRIAKHRSKCSQLYSSEFNCFLNGCLAALLAINYKGIKAIKANPTVICRITRKTLFILITSLCLICWIERICIFSWFLFIFCGTILHIHRHLTQLYIERAIAQLIDFWCEYLNNWITNQNNI